MNTMHNVSVFVLGRSVHIVRGLRMDGELNQRQQISQMALGSSYNFNLARWILLISLFDPNAAIII